MEGFKATECFKGVSARKVWSGAEAAHKALPSALCFLVLLGEVGVGPHVLGQFSSSWNSLITRATETSSDGSTIGRSNCGTDGIAGDNFKLVLVGISNAGRNMGNG
jgi:hypothetical protein